MSEKKVLVPHMQLTHKGTLDCNSIEHTILKSLKKRDYQLDDQSYDIEQTPDGLNQAITYTFVKQDTKYGISKITITSSFTHLKPVVLKTDVQTTLFSGEFTLTFKGQTITEHEGRIAHKPWLYFEKMILSKFVSRSFFPRPGTDIADTIFDTKKQVEHLLKHE
ncbi:MAG: hypothetical protein ACMXYF_04585 [Candidatus Woesearchaeota archaeon]